MHKILLSAPYMIPYVNRFKKVFDHYNLDLIVPNVKERMSEDEILTYAGLFDGAVCGDDRFTEDVIKTCLPRLKVISKWGTGIDSIDKEAANRLGVEVKNTLNAFTLPVADTVMGYILAFARQIPWQNELVKGGKWEKLHGRSLSECTLGVIGVGNIGKAVIRRAKAFGMKLIGNDIKPLPHDFVSENYLELADLTYMLTNADFISVNCDLNPSSFHLINDETLAMVKPSAIFINTARGPIVDESALVRALQDYRLAGAALDVFEVEPLPESSPLRQMSNVLLASHNSNSSPIAWENVHWNTIRNLLEGLGIETTDLDVLRKNV